MKTLLTTLLILLTCLVFMSCETKSKPDAEVAKMEMSTPTTADLTERGGYLVSLMGCHDCHTPKKMTEQGPAPDMERGLMGYPNGTELPEIDKSEVTPGKWVLFNSDLTAAVGPWGVSFAANLTPHESGLGNWSYDQFKKAMKEGKHKGLDNGRMILPPMPWQAYRALKEEDLQAIYEYLKTIPAIDNVVPAPIPPNEL